MRDLLNGHDNTRKRQSKNGRAKLLRVENLKANLMKKGTHRRYTQTTPMVSKDPS